MTLLDINFILSLHIQNINVRDNEFSTGVSWMKICKLILLIK